MRRALPLRWFVVIGLCAGLCFSRVRAIYTFYASIEAQR